MTLPPVPLRCPECGAPCEQVTHLNLEPGVRYVAPSRVQLLQVPDVTSDIMDAAGKVLYENGGHKIYQPWTSLPYAVKRQYIEQARHLLARFISHGIVAACVLDT